mgnify:CR=1 FL=1
MQWNTVVKLNAYHDEVLGWILLIMVLMIFDESVDTYGPETLNLQRCQRSAIFNQAATSTGPTYAWPWLSVDRASDSSFTSWPASLSLHTDERDLRSNEVIFSLTILRIPPNTPLTFEIELCNYEWSLSGTFMMDINLQAHGKGLQNDFLFTNFMIYYRFSNINILNVAKRRTS